MVASATLKLLENSHDLCEVLLSSLTLSLSLEVFIRQKVMCVLTVVTSSIISSVESLASTRSH